jgi:hypothetical protein
LRALWLSLLWGFSRVCGDLAFRLSLTGMPGGLGSSCRGYRLGWAGNGLSFFLFFFYFSPSGPLRGGFALLSVGLALTAFRTLSSVSGLPPCFSPAWPGRPFHGSFLAAPRLAVAVASSTPWPCSPSPQFRQALALSPPQGPGASPTPGCPPLRISWWGQGATVWVGSSCASGGCWGFAGRGPVWHAALPPCCAAPLAAFVP